MSGRTFRSGDLAGSVPVIVSQALAHALFGDADAVGRWVRFGGTEYDEQITGVVGDLPGASVADGPMRTVYFPILDDLRSTPDVAPKTPLFAAMVDASLARARLTMLLLLVAAAATLALGIVGVYGVTSYVVGARTRELSLRMALGATSTDVRRMIVRQHSSAAAAGVLVGLAIAFVMTTLLRGLLYQVAVIDLRIFAGAAMAVVAVALLASWLPSRRVARLDLVSALRAE